MKIRALIAGLTLLAALAGPGNGAANASASDLEDLIRLHGQPVKRLDSHGRELSAEMLGDRVAVVSFVSVGCRIECVTRIMDLDRLARDLPAALRGRVVFLAIDTDPAVDDAPRLRAFAEGLLGPEPQLRFLPSDAQATKAVAEDLRYPATSLPEPPPRIILFDRRGQVAMSYGGDPLDAPRLARDIAVLDTFAQGLGHPPTQTDPTR